MNKPVLFRVTNNLKVGGVQRRLRALLPLLTEHYEVHIVTYKDKGVFFDELAELGVHTHFLPRKGHWNPVAIWRLARLFRKHRADIVHTHSFGGNIFGILAAALARVPVRIGQVHSRGLHWYGKSPFRRWKQCAEERSVLGIFAHHVLCVSQETMDYFQQKTGLPRTMLSVMHNGISFEPCQRSRRLFDLGVPQGRPLVGFVGRLTGGKGLTFFLRFAAKALQEREGAFHFAILGGGDPCPYRQLCKELGISEHVTFTGEMLDMRTVYPELDMLLFTSEPAHEGMPGVVLEACSHGLPVLARRTAPVEEIRGYYDRIAYVDDAAPASEQLERTILLPPDDSGRLRGEFSIEAMRDRTVQLYGDLLKRAAR